MLSPFSRRLLDWYARTARDLPWREHPHPYAVWVSEIMLQQTRVETVIPYFLRWMDRFPNLEALASASQQEVLAAWEGLGYYSRARNLHRAAQRIVSDYDGKIPEDVEQLRRLPGIGAYTAGAIASMAFGLDEAALDGNIRRVLSRVFDVQTPANSPAGQQELWELARQHLPEGQAGDYNQALMDLGAGICTPRRPDCPRCPAADLCLARLLGVQEERPVVPARIPIPHYVVTAAVLEQDGKVLIAQRPEQGLLGGLWEFPGGKLEDGEDLPDCLEREIQEELGVRIQVREPLGVYEHAYSHFRVTLHAFRCQVDPNETGAPQPIQPQALAWVTSEDLPDYPMGKIDRQISRQYMQVNASRQESSRPEGGEREPPPGSSGRQKAGRLSAGRQKSKRRIGGQGAGQ
jgi:A/G-specific adenine glycosylase